MKKLLKVSSVLAISVGIVLVAGGGWAVMFTYQNVASENITTPSDASIPDAPVRGPLTLKSQADIIRYHTLDSTGGKTYADLPGRIPQVDEDGQPVLDEDGEPVMISNPDRTRWITATSLTTALHLGVITYLFSGLIILLGAISIWTGIIFHAFSKKQ